MHRQKLLLLSSLPASGPTAAAAAAALRVSGTSLQPKTWPAAQRLRAPPPPPPKPPTSPPPPPPRSSSSSVANGPDTSWSWRASKTTTTPWRVPSEVLGLSQEQVSLPAVKVPWDGKAALPSYSNKQWLVYSSAQITILYVWPKCSFYVFMHVQVLWWVRRMTSPSRVTTALCKMYKTISIYGNVKAYAEAVAINQLNLNVLIFSDDCGDDKCWWLPLTEGITLLPSVMFTWLSVCWLDFLFYEP